MSEKKTPESISSDIFDPITEEEEVSLSGGAIPHPSRMTHEISENDGGHYECDDHD